MSEPTSATDGALLQLADRLRENQVFGPVVERDGVTVVPVATVRGGGGLGGPEARARTRPTGASASPPAPPERGSSGATDASPGTPRSTSRASPSPASSSPPRCSCSSPWPLAAVAAVEATSGGVAARGGGAAGRGRASALTGRGTVRRAGGTGGTAGTCEATGEVGGAGPGQVGEGGGPAGEQQEQRRHRPLDAAAGARTPARVGGDELVPGEPLSGPERGRTCSTRGRPPSWPPPRASARAGPGAG